MVNTNQTQQQQQQHHAYPHHQHHHGHHPTKRRCLWLFWNPTRLRGSDGVHGRIIIIFLMGWIQCFWWCFDAYVTHTIPHPVPKPRIRPTESSPLTPFYHEPYLGPTKAFPRWSHPTFPCGPVVTSIPDMGARSSTKTGLLYIKEMKTGSTTLSGVTARIARNVAQRQYKKTQQQSNGTSTTTSITADTSTMACTSRFVHLRARRFYDRDRTQSFLWSVVREPTTRMISKFFHFAVSRDGILPTVSNFQSYLHDNEVTDFAYYFKTLTLRPKLNPYRHDLYERVFLQDILDQYDFLGVTERMDESLVVLQLLLGLETYDILYLPAKLSGSYDYVPAQRRCIPIQKAVITHEMKEWLYSEDVEIFLAPDILVYRAANASLDRTIAELGQHRVDEALRKFRAAQRMVQEECASKTRYPCSQDGIHQPENDCLQQDVACGYQCLDQVSKKLGSM